MHCSAVPCYAVPCPALLGYACLCLCSTLLCSALYSARPGYATLCHVTSNYLISVSSESAYTEINGLESFATALYMCTFGLCPVPLGTCPCHHLCARRAHQ